MTRSVGVLLLTSALAVAVPAAARAQAAVEDQGFINVSVGSQVQTRTIRPTFSFPLYDENATVTGDQKVGRGLLVDVNAGRRIWNRVFGSIGVTLTHASGDSNAVSNVPDPLVFNNPAISNITVNDLGQTVFAINLQAVWFVPINDTLDLAIGLGPSILHVSQHVATVDVPPGTNIGNPATAEESKWTAKAGTVSFDVSFKLNETYRMGLFAKYLYGEADMPSTPKMIVGGAQIGLGLRMRF